ALWCSLGPYRLAHLRGILHDLPAAQEQGREGLSGQGTRQVLALLSLLPTSRTGLVLRPRPELFSVHRPDGHERSPVALLATPPAQHGVPTPRESAVIRSQCL